MAKHGLSPSLVSPSQVIMCAALDEIWHVISFVTCSAPDHTLLASHSYGMLAACYSRPSTYLLCDSHKDLITLFKLQPECHISGGLPSHSRRYFKGPNSVMRVEYCGYEDRGKVSRMV